MDEADSQTYWRRRVWAQHELINPQRQKDARKLIDRHLELENYPQSSSILFCFILNKFDLNVSLSYLFSGHALSFSSYYLKRVNLKFQPACKHFHSAFLCYILWYKLSGVVMYAAFFRLSECHTESRPAEFPRKLCRIWNAGHSQSSTHLSYLYLLNALASYIHDLSYTQVYLTYFVSYHV